MKYLKLYEEFKYEEEVIEPEDLNPDDFDTVKEYLAARDKSILEKAQRQFIDRMEKIIDNEELLENISKNGRIYYENNCTLNKIAQNAMELINLNLLK